MYAGGKNGADREWILAVRRKDRLIYAGVVLLMIIALAVQSAVIYAAVSVSDGNAAGGVLVFIVAAVCVAVTVFLFKCAFAVLSTLKDEINNLTAMYIDSFSDAEREQVERQSQKKKRRVKIAAFVAAAGVISVLIAVGISNHLRVSRPYDRAMAYIDAGDFNAARAELESIKDSGYKDTEAFIKYCKARSYYQFGDAQEAYLTMLGVNFYHCSTEQRASVGEFYNRVKKEYEDGWAAVREKERLEAEELDRRIKSGVPFIALKESRIGDTILGKPARNNNFIADDGSIGRKYFFYDEQGRTIFIAYCLHGEVIRITDCRDSPVVNSEPRHYVDTGPDVSGYEDPEEFYYWHYDDFYDFEDAEDYYYSHGGR